MIVDVEQGTPEWHLIRCGRITGSRIKAIMTKGKDGAEFGKVAMGMAYTIASEILTGIPEDNISLGNFEHGHEMEPHAILHYEVKNFRKVQKIGFFRHPLNDMLGYSPDGFVDDDGMVEVKSPVKRRIHLINVDKFRVPEEYVDQIQFGLWVSDRKWCDFISYNEHFKNKKLMQLRVHRDEKYIRHMQQRTFKFISIVNQIVKRNE